LFQEFGEFASKEHKEIAYVSNIRPGNKGTRDSPPLFWGLLLLIPQGILACFYFLSLDTW